MPARTIGIALVLIAVLTVAIYFLLGRDPRSAARHGWRPKRRLLTTGLTILAMLGLGSTPACEDNTGQEAGPRVEPPVQATAPTPAPVRLNLDGTRFGPPGLDTRNQPLGPRYSPPPPLPTTVESILTDLEKPKKRSKRQHTTCYIIRMAPNKPALITPALILQRMHWIHELTARNALSAKALEKIWLGVDALIDQLERQRQDQPGTQR